MTTVDAGRLVEVRLVQMPLPMMAKAQEQGDGLMREFALIATSMSSDSVPVRLQQLADQLQTQYSMYTEDTQREIDEATQRGEQELDVTFRVPAAAAEACFVLNDMLEEVDEFCRSEEHTSELQSR